MNDLSDATSAPGPRGAGRPSTVARYAPSIVRWLRDEPALSSAEILRRIRLDGYRGGKSAFYDLVRRLRTAEQHMNRSGLGRHRASGE